MKLKLALLALIAGTSMIAQAQTATEAPKARADVKAEAKTAVKAGELATGDKPVADKPGAKSTATRGEVKAEAKTAVKAGAIESGDAPKK